MIFIIKVLYFLFLPFFCEVAFKYFTLCKETSLLVSILAARRLSFCVDCQKMCDLIVYCRKKKIVMT